MQKVFKNCYELDENCYTTYGLSEDYLMHHASLGMAEYIRFGFPKGSSILIVSGPGNNGSDGVVLARELSLEYTVSLLMPFGALGKTAKIQLEQSLNAGVKVVDLVVETDIVVDALFGAGLNKPLDKQTNILLEELNGTHSFKIACDIPTGVGENFTNIVCFKANTTITMGALKESLFEDKNLDFVGDVLKVDLGLESSKYELETDTYLVDKSDMKLPTRSSKNTHKGTFGHTAIVSGEKVGASIMTAMATVRFGSGLTTLVLDTLTADYVPPYLMTSNNIPVNTTAIAIGMGLGNSFSKAFLQTNIVNSNTPLVVDADMFYRSDILDLLQKCNQQIVLTPHPKEFANLWSMITKSSVSIDDIQNSRFSMVKEFSTRFPHIVLVLKGANMLIAHSNKVYINEIGTSKLSKGGSGDVLSGLIASLLAQGYSSLDAAISGTLALAISAENYDGATYSMLPTDIIDGVTTLENKC